MFADAIASVSKSDQVIGVGVNCTPPEYIEVQVFLVSKFNKVESLQYNIWAVFSPALLSRAGHPP